MKNAALSRAFVYSLPILCSYLFVGMAYGILMNEAGFTLWQTGLMSLFVYTGAFQFMFIALLGGGASLLTVALSALLLNSRQSFYELTFIKDFSSMKGKKLFMMHTLTDETYAIDCTLEGEERHETMFWLHLLSWLYWFAASVLGFAVGMLLPWQPEGIDFCMTALFVVLFLGQWEKAVSKKPALIGLGCALLALIVFGPSAFMLPALLATSALLILWNQRKAPAVEAEALYE